MKDSKEQIKINAESAPQVVAAAQAEDIPEAALLAERVTEVAKTGASEDQGSGGGHIQDEDEAKPEQSSTAMKNDRAALREQLLENAPKKPVMKAEVVRILEKKRTKLESDIKKHRRKRDFRLLSDAIMQLRSVMHQLESIAKASLEALQGIWLKLVHGFA
jgi:hypothetical protein